MPPFGFIFYIIHSSVSRNVPRQLRAPQRQGTRRKFTG